MAGRSRKDWTPSPGETIVLSPGDIRVSHTVLEYIQEFGFGPMFRYLGKDWWDADAIGAFASQDGRHDVEEEMLGLLKRLGPDVMIGFEVGE